MKRKRNTKRGSYIAEAVLIMPVFILAAVTLISIVPITAACENAVFAAADELRMESVKSVFRNDSSALGILTEKRIKEENPKICDYRTDRLRYRYSKRGISDLITLKANVLFRQKAPFGIFGETSFNFQITGRAFTGSSRRNPPLPGEEFEKSEKSQPVCVFPEWGEKYHRRDCTYVRASCRMVRLDEEIKRKYRPCKKCGADKAGANAAVFCFPESGRTYHLGHCRTVKRYYIEMDKEDARRKGYVPCSKCGGI